MEFAALPQKNNNEKKITEKLMELLNKGGEHSIDEDGKIAITKLDENKDILKMEGLPEGITFKTDGDLIFENMKKVPDHSTYANNGSVEFNKNTKMEYDIIFENKGDTYFINSGFSTIDFKKSSLLSKFITVLQS